MRPTKEDLEALELLLEVDTVSEKSAQFIEDLYARSQNAEYQPSWSVKQCQWFDQLCERYL